MAKESPTNRTVRFLEARGIIAGNVERFVKQAGPFGTRFDLFGFIDVIACYPGEVAGLQITSDNNLRDRVAKILEERPEQAKAFLLSSGRIEVWGWAKKGAAGKAKRWTPRVECIRLDGAGKLVTVPVPDPGDFPRRTRRRIRAFAKT